MRIGRVAVAFVMLLAVGGVRPTAAQTLVQQPIDVLLTGDDPGVLLPFDLTADPLAPILVRLDGVFQNVFPFETVVRYDLSWSLANGSGFDAVGIDFMPLHPTDPLPISFQHFIPFTPDDVILLIEGGGPGDHFRFTGEFSIQQVPEPDTLALLWAAAAVGVCGWLGRKRRALDVS